jgi:uncharacterized protein (TIGR02145 family)
MTIRKKHRICYNAILLLLLISVFGCEKDKTPVYSGETVTDVDGNLYNTVKIGDQLWMAEDLKVGKYNDGTTIPYIIEKAAWVNTSTGACCWYNNEKSWGTLYNWYAVNTDKLAPAGWHVATDEDYTTLTDFLGGENVAGGILKETGGEQWDTPNSGATNEYWFTALPGGFRQNDGSFSSFGSGGFWWSSTDFDGVNSWSRYLIWNGSNITRGHYEKRVGFSVRCIKD